MGPQDATLLVKTYRQGMASAVGHDLVIEVTRWEGTYTDGALELTADPESLVVREGNNGVKPLTDKDRRDIASKITEKVLGKGQIVFRSTGPNQGTLLLAGTSRPIAFTFDHGADGAFAAAAVVKQSDWGIKPYSAMLGALKVRDDVDVVAEGRLPG